MNTRKTQSKGVGKDLKPLNTKDEVSHPTFPIIGIGASAGGLDAIERFLGKLPSDNGVALIIVQHLDPTHKCLLVDLLQQKTTIPTQEITDNLRVQPNHIYVIPPNRDLTILHGVLYLLEPVEHHGIRTPIDFFLSALAEDQGKQAIAVILSGMGSDGTASLRMIKDQGGAIFIQDPETAQFDGMPKSAIASNLADAIASPEELPSKILSYLEFSSHTRTLPNESFVTSSRSDLEKIIALLRRNTGHDFSQYKKNTLHRRIERRMNVHQIENISHYIRFLRENKQESTLLFKELLIGVTSFFRDRIVWKKLQNKILPAIIKAHPEGKAFRAWIPGCSTGEEAYSLAIIFQEILEALQPSAQYSLQIFATDLDDEAISRARTAIFAASICKDISAKQLQRYFVPVEGGYRLKQEIREMVIFAKQNLIMEPPFTKLDLLICRNLLIYLELELQKKLISLFHYCLNDNGILLLGSAESIGQDTSLFKAIDAKLRIFERQPSATHYHTIKFPGAFMLEINPEAPNKIIEPNMTEPTNLKKLTDSILLRHYTPSAVLTTENGDILYISGKTSKYLEPPVGKANLNLFSMAREGINSLLYQTFNKAIKEKSIIKMNGIEVIENNNRLAVDITVEFLKEPPSAAGMLLIIFQDKGYLPSTTENKKSYKSNEKAKIDALSLELQKTREEVQTTREEMQTSQEELKSANEELQSTNEELQSTNEELTTSKEEMQSMNEELQTVNHELQSKVDELTSISDDMKNLLNSTEIATLFLDNDLKVRRFTEEATKIIKLIPGDAGRPISDITNDLDYPDMINDAQSVIDSLKHHEKRVSASSGRWFDVRIMPYRTQDNRIDGVVITFINSTKSKKQEMVLLDALSLLHQQYDVLNEKQAKPEAIIETLAETRDRLKKLLDQQD